MPHLDIASYITQISWFWILTLAFYLIIQAQILPTLATINNLSNNLENITPEKNNLSDSMPIHSQTWPILENPSLTFSFRWNMTQSCLNAFRSL